MSHLERAYYSASFVEFFTTSDEELLGHLALHSDLAVDHLQRNAWEAEFAVLRGALSGLDGHILLEYSIPRMGRRADVVLLFPKSVVVVEFKVGEKGYPQHAVDQVLDYALDLKNFQEQSHDKSIVPILLATAAPPAALSLSQHPDGVFDPVFANESTFAQCLREVLQHADGPPVSPSDWYSSRYRPTPTIVEAAQALYQGHEVDAISRSEAGAENLTRTAVAIAEIITASRQQASKAICFVTGVPGAGKTLAGLNIANSWHDPENAEHAVFLSGNGPLVDVLREALARDEVQRAKETGGKRTKASALSRVKAFIQNVHHFRDDALASEHAPVDRVVIFDEAQRAWDLKQTAAFMRSRKRIPDFGQSEPHFLISVMDRHAIWATVICLIGGGQEINKGEAGLAEWLRVLRDYYPEWLVFVSDELCSSDYMDSEEQGILAGIQCLQKKPNLHLSTSIRSFRAEALSSAVEALLALRRDDANSLFAEVMKTYPVVLTRDIMAAKKWLTGKARGTERYGVIASSEAMRLRPHGINVKVEIDPRHWFLNDKSDVRSSCFLEDVATEFQIQGLELDWACVAWDGDLRYKDGQWAHHGFSGTKWKRINSEVNRRYLENAYRVLLTRARQGMVIFVPHGESSDYTRAHEYYDGTYRYLRSLGIPEISAQQDKFSVRGKPRPSPLAFGRL